MSFPFTETTTLELPDVAEGLTSFREKEFRNNHGLIIEINAIHAGLTSNFNMYSAEELEKSLGTWVSPYARPIIRDHDPSSNPMGRVMASAMGEESDGTRFIKLQAAITDSVAMERVADKRYLTGSVGGRSEHAICSICSKDWAEAGLTSLPCKHQRGKIYNGKLAYLEMKDIEFKEYSFVNMPADKNSTLRIIDGAGTGTSEWTHVAKMYSLDMTKESIVELNNFQENVNILDDMKKKQSTPLYLSLKGAFLSSLSYNVEESNNDTTIDVQEETLVDNVSQRPQNTIEENKNMSKVNSPEVEDDDILAVAESLNATEAAEEDVTELSATEANEEQSEVTEESVESDAPVETEESESNEGDNSETQEDELTEATEAVEETTPVGAVETTDELTESEVEEDERDAKIATLVEENTRLRSALHNMLAQRVVDTKIALGLHESSERVALIETHASRSAASLADSLKDLSGMTPVVKGVTPEVVMESKSLPVDTNTDKIITEGQDKAEESKQIDAETLFHEVLMGRQKL